MRIAGMQKTTLLDFPGKMAAIVFTGGCNFACPYCHNSELISWGDDVPLMAEDEVFAYLNKRKNVLEGLVISGGEPTLQRGLEDFIRRVRDLGYLIKLDTNGTTPKVLMDLCGKGLIDYVAMDVKGLDSLCPRICGLTKLDPAAQNVLQANMQESIDYLLTGRVAYEFRTTLVQGLHTAADVEGIAARIRGASAYFLQNYRESETVLCKDGLSPFSREQLEQFLAIVKKYVPVAQIRG
ncbi:MAG: anaerobic ribonucleoside-triphosphate reductase activating protein [Lachnospiraceae bacterium]|nr:anaerobic ribonucleoside-triphosphate reductase activating protein [Lachnospiraceae bacterium]